MWKKWSLKLEDKRIWLILGGSVLFSFILSLLVISIDTRVIPLLEVFPAWTQTSVDLAKEILSLLAGSLFSVATFTLSTMLVIISLYSSNFSPRTVENFLLNKTSMQTLGIFLGGFIYCLSSLFFMRSSEDEYLVVSATVALLYAFACVIYFTKFVYHVSNFVQLGKLVNKLYREANEVYDQTIETFKDKPTVIHLPDLRTLHQYTIKSEKSAYMEYVDFQQLVSLCEEHKASLVMHASIGIFASKRQPIATFYTNRKVEDKEKLNQEINRAITYETEQSTLFDPNYARKKLTEVALRAVSPGINDPNTAIHILHYKALLETKFADLPGKYAILGEMQGEANEKDESLQYSGCVFYKYNDFANDLYEGYWQLIHYMKEDISGVSALFEALTTIAYSANAEKLGYIKEYSEYMYNVTCPNFTEPLDRQRIEGKYQTILNIVPPDSESETDHEGEET